MVFLHDDWMLWEYLYVKLFFESTLLQSYLVVLFLPVMFLLSEMKMFPKATMLIFTETLNILF